LDTTRKFNTEFKTYREELKRPYRAEPDVLSKLTREAYDRMTEEVRASHILVMVKPDALPSDTLTAYNKISEIKKRITGGENFAKLAQELSEDPSAKYNGGDIGYFTAMQMVYPFEQAAYSLKPEEISTIVRTRFGYHLIKLNDRKPARGEVEVAHILLRKDGTNDTKIKNKAFEIIDQLKAGRNWDELCKEYSDDGNTKNTGGKLRPFGVGALAATVPEFEATAFSLQQPGEISDPFESSVGWHIMRLEKKIPIAPFSELETALRRKVSKDERVQLSELRLEEKRKRDFRFSEDAVIKERVFSFADSSLIKKKWKYTGPAELKSKQIFSLGDKIVEASAFIRYCEQNTTSVSMPPKQYMQQLYNHFISEQLGEVEEEKLKRENPDFRNLMNEYREGILLFEIMEKEVWNRASEDTAGQRNYYNQNLARYKAGDRAEARVFATSDKNFLTTIKSKISQGDSIKESELKRFKSVQNFRNYEKGDSKILDRVSWVTGIHEVELDGLYYLVEIRSLVAPGTKTFEDARASVISDYQDHLEKNWVKQLKEKYPVKVNKKTKKLVVEELTRK
jgi:Parvulin-like peptidyl-prolyl isomerase